MTALAFLPLICPNQKYKTKQHHSLGLQIHMLWKRYKVHLCIVNYLFKPTHRTGRSLFCFSPIFLGSSHFGRSGLFLGIYMQRRWQAFEVIYNKILKYECAYSRTSWSRMARDNRNCSLNWSLTDSVLKKIWTVGLRNMLGLTNDSVLKMSS